MRVSRSLQLGLLIAGTAALLIGVLAWLQVGRERTIDLEDVDRRAHALAWQFADGVAAWHSPAPLPRRRR